MLPTPIVTPVVKEPEVVVPITPVTVPEPEVPPAVVKPTPTPTQIVVPTPTPVIVTTTTPVVDTKPVEDTTPVDTALDQIVPASSNNSYIYAAVAMLTSSIITFVLLYLCGCCRSDDKVT